MGIGIGNSNISTNVVNNYFGGTGAMGMMQQNPMMQMMQMMMGAMQGMGGGPCQEMMGGMGMPGMGMPGMGMPGMGMPGMDGMSGFSPMMGNNIGNFLGMQQQNPMMQMMQMMMQMMQMMMMMMGGGANPFMGGMMPGMMGGMPGMGGGMPGMGGMGGGFPGMGGGMPGMGGMGGGMPYAGAYAGPNGAGAFAGTGGAGGAGAYTGPMGTGSGAAAVNVGRQFLGQNAIDIKGKMPHFTAAGGQTNNCADFVSSCLESQGLIKGHHINVKEMEQSLIKQGYRQIPLNQAKAGDVWMNSSRGHTELVQGFQNGKLKLIGSNNDRPGHQVISEGSATSGVVYSRQ
ncbi:MAG: peptidoglycan amidohydrolase family protein [Candidatus Eremiobacterota bacterium]